MAEAPSILILVHTDRTKPGTLRVVDAQGDGLVVPCLARAAREIATAARNPSRNPLKRNGDTPTGTYRAPKGVLMFGRYLPSYGNGIIGLDPIGGQAQAAEDNGRAGLAIHGGRGDRMLTPTAGCVRVFDKDFAAIAKAIGRAKGFTVEIREAE